MIKIKYVGVKTDGERAFKDDTGIEWFPGDVHEVSEENAGKMLRHPDVFQQIGNKPVALADAPTLKAVTATDHDADDEAIAREEAAKNAEAEAAKAKELESKSQESEPAKPVKAAKPAAKKAAPKKAAAKKAPAKKAAKA